MQPGVLRGGLGQFKVILVEASTLKCGHDI